MSSCVLVCLPRVKVCTSQSSFLTLGIFKSVGASQPRSAQGLTDFTFFTLIISSSAESHPFPLPHMTDQIRVFKWVFMCYCFESKSYFRCLLWMDALFGLWRKVTAHFHTKSSCFIPNYQGNFDLISLCNDITLLYAILHMQTCQSCS